MNLNEIAKMCRYWPPETAKIVGRKDYGSDFPVPSLLFRAWQATKNAVKAQWANEKFRIDLLSAAGVLVVAGLCLFTLLQVMPGAIDGLMEHQKQIAIESTK